MVELMAHKDCEQTVYLELGCLGIDLHTLCLVIKRLENGWLLRDLRPHNAHLLDKVVGDVFVLEFEDRRDLTPRLGPTGHWISEKREDVQSVNK